jgi:hypothetical protein
MATNQVYKIAPGTNVASLVAGTGYFGSGGDRGPAKAAQLRRPMGLWIDSTGLYIADTDNNRVRWVNGRTGVITTVAGNGYNGRSSNKVATKALLQRPQSVRTNGSGGLDIGNLFGGAYVNLKTGSLTATSTHGPVFAVDPSNNTYSVAASVAHPATDVPPVVKYANHSTRPVPYLGTPAYGGPAPIDGTPAVSADLPYPITWLASDAGGNLYFSGGGNIYGARYVDAATKRLHTVSGFSGWSLDQDTKVVVAPNGDLYVTAFFDREILRRDHTNGVVSLVAGGWGDKAHCGANLARLWEPSGVTSLAHDAAGNVFVATALDPGDPPGIFEIRSDGSLTTIEDNHQTGGTGGDGGPVSAATFDNIKQLTVGPTGDLYIADGNRIRRVDHATQIIDTIAGTGTNGDTGDGGPATAAELQGVSGVAVDPAGNVYIGEYPYWSLVGRLRRVDGVTGDISTVAGGPSGTVTPTPAGVAADTAAIAVGQLSTDSSGRVYFGSGDTAYRYDPPDVAHPTGTVTMLAGTELYGHNNVETDAAGDVFIISRGAVGPPTVTRLDHDTLAPHIVYEFGGFPCCDYGPGSSTIGPADVVGDDVDFGWDISDATTTRGAMGVRQLVDAAHAPDNTTPR